MRDSHILEIATKNAKKYRPPDRETIYERDWENQHVIFEINKGKVIMNQRNPTTFEEQFNMEKRILVSSFLENYVLDDSMTCTIPFDMNMHDFVNTNMNSSFYPHSILGASILIDDPINIPVPDFYAMQGYRNSIHEEDQLPFEHKVNKLYFIGGSTGDTNPSRNKRIKLCQYAQHVSWLDSYISEIVQMKAGDLYHYDPFCSYYIHNHIPATYQKMYRHLISTDGNTAAWDRVPWILSSNSVLWKEDSPHICWYYPFLTPWEHYIPFTLEDLSTKWHAYRERDTDLLALVQRANQFVHDFLHIKKHALYMKMFFQKVIEIYNP